MELDNPDEVETQLYVIWLVIGIQLVLLLLTVGWP